MQQIVHIKYGPERPAWMGWHCDAILQAIALVNPAFIEEAAAQNRLKSVLQIAGKRRANEYFKAYRSYSFELDHDVVHSAALESIAEIPLSFYLGGEPTSDLLAKFPLLPPDDQRMYSELYDAGIFTETPCPQ